MPSVSEAAILQIMTLMRRTGATVERNTPLSEQLAVPSDGLIVVRDGDPGEPEVVLGQLSYQYDHEVEIEIYLQQRAEDVDACFDDLRQKVGLALVANRDLGGRVMWVEPRAAKPIDLPLSSELPVKAATITVVMTYSSSLPVN
jgi:hypothetical protein